MGILSRRNRRRSKGSFANRVPIFRWLGPGLTFGGVLLALYMVFTGQIDFSKLDQDTTAQPVSLEQTAPRPSDTIRIATFNIKTFGEKKSSTRVEQGVDVMGTIAQIVSNFDLVAIQEVRSQDGVPIQRLVDLLNASGGSYTATVSEPIGGKFYKESYAYVWDSSRIKIIQNSAYVVHDQYERMSREPMVASFQTRVPTTDGRQPFRFTLINAHTDPDEVSAQDIANEINVLDDVYVRVREYENKMSGEDDFILLGDLNVSTASLQELAMIPNLYSVAGNIPTNTRKSATYDHILIDRANTNEHIQGRFGVVDYERDLGLTREQALLISDHIPVWAEFSAYETPQLGPIATTGTRMIR